jgi:hypothetical protein
MTVALLLAAAPDRLSAMDHPYWHPGDQFAVGAPWLDYMGDRLMSAGVRQVDVAMCADAADGLRAVAATARDLGEPVLVCTSTRALTAPGSNLAALLGGTRTTALVADGALLVASEDLTAVAEAAEELAARIARGEYPGRPSRLSIRRLIRTARVAGELDSAVETLIACVPGHGVQVVSLDPDGHRPAVLASGRAWRGTFGSVGGNGGPPRHHAQSRAAAPPEPGLVAGFAVAPLASRLGRWTAALRMGPDAPTVIALALSLCAAAWYAQDTRSSLVTGSLLLGAALPLRLAPGWRRGRGSAGPEFGSWLGALSGAAAEYAVYAGLAVGWAARAASHAHQAWTFAIAAMILLAVRQMADACYARMAARPAAGGRPGLATGSVEAQRDGTRRQPCGNINGSAHKPQAGAGKVQRLLRLAAQSIQLPSGERMVLIAVVTPVWGPGMTLVLLIGWGAVAFGYVLAERAVTGRAGIQGQAQAKAQTGADRAGTDQAGGAQAAAARAIVASRDDGPLATRIGGVVRGQLTPLLPTIAGIIVTVMLAAAGLHNMPGPLLLTPAVAMLLAALGADNPHTGRADWLVPPLLQAGQYVYLAALGAGTGVPAPATFALVAAIALHHMDLLHRDYAHRGPRGLPPSHGVVTAGLGWEGRMLVAGFGGILGIGTFVFIGLAGYLWVLFGWDSLTSWLAAPG